MATRFDEESLGQIIWSVATSRGRPFADQERYLELADFRVLIYWVPQYQPAPD